MEQDLDNPGKAAIWKIKWLLCVCLFLVFVLCDRGKIVFPGKSSSKNGTELMYQKLEENYDYTKLQKYVMMISDFAQE